LALPSHDEPKAAAGGDPVRSWQGPTPPVRPVEIIGIVLALAQLIVAVVGLIQVPGGVRLVVSGLSVGVAIGYLLCMSHLRREADRLALAPVDLSASSLVAAILVTCGTLFLAIPVFQGRLVLVDGGLIPSVALALGCVSLGCLAGYAIGWTPAALAHAQAAEARRPSVPRWGPAVAAILASVLLMLWWQTSRVSAPSGAWCPRDPAAPQATSSSGELLARPLGFTVTPPDQVGECYQAISPNALSGRTRLTVTYDLHGLRAQGQDASALVIDQGDDDACVNRPGCRWHYVSLSRYGTNGKDGPQTVEIPLTDFPGLDPGRPVDGTLHLRVWSDAGPFTVEVSSVVAG